MENKLILITSPQRLDVYEYLLPHFDEVIIPVSEKVDVTSKVKQVLYSNYKNPISLIEEINPHYIIFMEVFDFLQISLCVAANHLKVKTFFLEHGFTGKLKGQDKKNRKGFFKVIFRRLKSLARKGGSFIQNRKFYFSVWNLLKTREKLAYLKLYILTEIVGNYFALRKISLRKRVPDCLILFNRNNESLRNGLYHYKDFEDVEVKFTGLPYVNKYKTKPQENSILFIDHPYYEVSILNWDEAFHASYVNSIYKLAKDHQELNVTVKLHPLSNIKHWQKFEVPENVTILQSEAKEHLNQIYETAELIFSFSSTLVIGFLSNQRNVILLGWSPEPVIEGWNKSALAITHQSYSFSDLSKHFKEWKNENKAIINYNSYKEFLDYYNPNFDGKAVDRIINLISA